MSDTPSAPFGVLLVNLGTPKQPTTAGVRDYLAEFLWDRRVIQAPRLIWWFALHCVILVIRPRKVAHLYQSVDRGRLAPAGH
ncbi:MAG TPA: ferrochelatase [Dongiaceae bacterium]|nr:ferrochelatase [Dongiaceae bacterium]